MKKVFYSALLVMGLSVSTLAATGNETKNTITVSPNVQARFESRYAGAESVTWTATNQFQKAIFTLNGVPMTAFYNLANEYIATTQISSADRLAAAVKVRLEKTYKGYTVNKVIQYDNGQTIYFVDLKKDQKEVLVRVMPDNNVYFFKQIK